MGFGATPLADQTLRVEKVILHSDKEPLTKNTEEREKLNNVLAQVIDSTLKQVFRQPGAKVIYDYLEKNQDLKIKEITEKPELFSESMRKLLGSAAPVIEDLIIRNLCAQFNTKFEDKDGCEFSCYIRELREKYRC
jgi:hypothetical protein